MKFAFIAEEAELGIGRLCRVLSVSRAGFYAWKLRPPSAHDVEDERLKILVREAHQIGRGYYGSPRVHRALKCCEARWLMDKRSASVMAITQDDAGQPPS